MARAGFARLVFGSLLAAAAAGRSEEPAAGRPLLGHRGMVTSLAFSLSGERLVSTGVDGTVRVWNVATGEARVVGRHRDEAYAAAFSPDGRYLASAGYDRSLLLWNAASGRLLGTVALPSWSTALAFLPSGDVVLATQGGEVLQVAMPAGQVVRRLEAPAAVNALVVIRAGQGLFTGGPLRLWDLRSGEAQALKAAGGVSSVAISGDGRRLASGHRRGVAYVWDTASGERVQQIPVETPHNVLGPTGFRPGRVAFPVAAVALSPDGTRLATGGVDRTIRLWDVAQATQLQSLEGHTRQVTALAWSADGRTLASAGADAALRLWRIEADAR